MHHCVLVTFPFYVFFLWIRVCDHHYNSDRSYASSQQVDWIIRRENKMIIPRKTKIMSAYICVNRHTSYIIYNITTVNVLTENEE